MKKVLASSVVVLMVFFLSAGLGLAGNGKGGGNGGGGNGVGGGGGGTGIPIHDIFAGTPFDYSGDVIEIGTTDGGITIDIGDDEVTIYGIGSVRYWVLLGVDRPVVSDTIDVIGYNVIYSTDADGTEVSRNIATEITVGGKTVGLRDPETGRPLWRGGNGNSN